MEAIVDGSIHIAVRIHFIMAMTAKRISVVRIPRQLANQVNPADVQDQRPKPLLTRIETPAHYEEQLRGQDVIFTCFSSTMFIRDPFVSRRVSGQRRIFSLCLIERPRRQ